MKIGFVAEPYEESNASGMGYVVIEFLKNLPLGPEDTLTIYSSKPVSKSVIPIPHTNIIVPASFFGKLFYFFRLKDKIDVLLFVAPLLPLIVPRRVKTVLICQEIASQKTPVYGIRERALAILRDHILMTWCIKRSAKVIAASGATKTDVHTFYTVADDKVQVIYDGYQDLSVYKDTAPVVDQNLKPFFFFAGKVKGRKNVHGIVSGFIAFKKRTPNNTKLVLAGDYGGSYYEKIKQEIQQNDLEQDVVWAGYTVGARLYSFYTNALALVFPSFNEGFGMPPCEAMSLGLPVITSNLSSMAEVVGEAGLLVDPYNIEDISNAMEQIYSNDSLREKLITKGYERSKEFSWPKAARELMQTLNTLS